MPHVPYSFYTEPLTESVPPKLGELLTHCRANGSRGKYRTVREGDQWRAFVIAGNAGGNGLAPTKEAALGRVASVVLGFMTEPKRMGLGSDNFPPR